ncbi:PON1-like protein [Mya arenaria]|uniref:PON1-like protein n=1 Tax=Mya arenaria TaxID=6604 RepID=A0ABY7FS60_MYAAR|nr:PON1-like protein [Mya arenaria]
MVKGFNWEGDVGQLLAFNISGEKTQEITLNISNSPRRADFLGAPHGITTWTDPDTGEVFLYVLTHPKAEDRIEVFEVQKSPVSLRTVYMAEWGKKTLHAYRRESNNKLKPLWKEYLDTGIDNINVDQETGDLWIGSHPVTWRIVDFFGIFGKHTAPSQVLRVKVSDGGVDAVEEIYSDNGEEIAGSTAAVYAEGKLMVASVFEQAITCDVEYLSK